MNLQSPSEKAQYLVTSLEENGQSDYIGESISQLEHCLQAANQAKTSGAKNELIIAALLHDIGQIVPLESTKAARMTLKNSTEDLGRVGHEMIGAEFLRALGFSRDVCHLVGSHVAAKRYLTAVNNSYWDSLSSASKKSLECQGGPFKGAELVAFEQDPLRDEMVAMRRWDDAAKVEGIKDSTPRPGAYFDMIRTHLEQQGMAC
ncbi:hypothetical protein P168DRAFT_323456 [Aspergillus campestris IBT 28561]|uniref:HD domain-containing protein n=1 Tax=Aspergillus campestris (strain IBT 28561) TaxID=1392248 RepID=A0A2I1DEJ1_ASPC2|nr:uncharacterized protein P168DRAFT_323456 [Aspergillus campestris IBT 28561]PKY08299.1 hypothetical protein P168DRAFT_323456 [Aspergillus campestris IBT 28561]